MSAHKFASDLVGEITHLALNNRQSGDDLNFSLGLDADLNGGEDDFSSLGDRITSQAGLNSPSPQPFSAGGSLGASLHLGVGSSDLNPSIAKNSTSRDSDNGNSDPFGSGTSRSSNGSSSSSASSNLLNGLLLSPNSAGGSDSRQSATTQSVSGHDRGVGSNNVMGTGTGWNASTSYDKLYVRVNQPVESCELEPYATVRLSHGAGPSDLHPQLSYRWMRSVDRLPCAFARCSTNRVMESDQGDSASRARAREAMSRREHTFQCVQCVKAGRGHTHGELLSVFCSRRCVVRGWREHMQYHAALGDFKNNNASGSLRPGEEMDDVLWRNAHSVAAEGIETINNPSNDTNTNGSRPSRNSGQSSAHSKTASSASTAMSVVLRVPDKSQTGGASSAAVSGSSSGPTRRTTGIQVSGSSDDAEIMTAPSSSSFSLGNSNNTNVIDPSNDLNVPQGWTVVCDTKQFRPGPSDVGHRLRLEVYARISEERGLRQFADTPFVLPRPPSTLPRRYMLSADIHPQLSSHSVEELARVRRSIRLHGLRDEYGSPTALRIVNYNILAEIYASQQQYPYVPLWQLMWNYRGNVILRVIAEQDADVICLQEVQSDAFDAQIQPYFVALGYEALYKTKTREHGLSGKIDGCATFFKKSRLQLKSYYQLELNEVATAFLNTELRVLEQKAQQRPPNISQTDYETRRYQLEAAEKRLRKDNVAQVAILHLIAGTGPRFEPLQKPVPLLVVCTHLHWDPALADVKLWQTSCLIKEIEKLQQSESNHLAASGLLQPGQSSLPLLLCGDLNSEPSSAVYKLLSNNVLHGLHGRRRVDLTQQDLPNDPCNILGPYLEQNRLGHGMLLASLYSQVTGAEPPFTNLTRDFTGTLDYVFTNIDCVTPLTAAEVPLAEVLTGNKKGSKKVTLGSVSSGTGTFGGGGGGGGGGSTSSGKGSGAGAQNNNSSHIGSKSGASSQRDSTGTALDNNADNEEEEDSVALPNTQNPSDHVPLIFEVDIAPWYTAMLRASGRGIFQHGHANGGVQTHDASQGHQVDQNGGDNTARMGLGARQTSHQQHQIQQQQQQQQQQHNLPPSQFQNDVLKRLAERNRMV
jgi:CCR4-NOT transcription complex subunit 6